MFYFFGFSFVWFCLKLKIIKIPKEIIENKRIKFKKT